MGDGCHCMTIQRHPSEVYFHAVYGFYGSMDVTIAGADIAVALGTRG